eukprot:jgi/Galph1/1413/GphlegSOOS_G108.1
MERNEELFHKFLPHIFQPKIGTTGYSWYVQVPVEVEQLEAIVNRESPFLEEKARPVIILNASLIDMGATGKFRFYLCFLRIYH